MLVKAFGMEQTLGNVLFAATFLITDILSECEGKRAVEIFQTRLDIVNHSVGALPCQTEQKIRLVEITRYCFRVALGYALFKRSLAQVVIVRFPDFGVGD